MAEEGAVSDYVDDLLLDLSHYDLATFDAGCFYKNGVRRVILGTYSRNATIQMIVGCRNNGIEVVGLYWLPYFGDSDYYVNRDIDTAIAIATRYGIGTVWVDAEIDAWQIGVDVPPSNASQRVAQLQGQLDKVTAADKRAGIYTAKWWWNDNTGHSTAFARYPLWHAIYTNGPRPTPGFGGWAKAEIHQYTSERVLCGRVRDHNYLFTAVDAEAITEEDMTPQEVEAIVARMVFGSPERLAELADNASLEARVAALEENGDIPARERIKTLEESPAGGLKRGDTVVLG